MPARRHPRHHPPGRIAAGRRRGGPPDPGGCRYRFRIPARQERHGPFGAPGSDQTPRSDSPRTRRRDRTRTTRRSGRVRFRHYQHQPQGSVSRGRGGRRETAGRSDRAAPRAMPTRSKTPRGTGLVGRAGPPSTCRRGLRGGWMLALNPARDGRRGLVAALQAAAAAPSTVGTQTRRRPACPNR